MNGLIALVGAGEYLPVMDGVDRYLLSSLNSNGRAPRVVCLPTAAGQEGEASVTRWSQMGVEHFRQLGAEAAALQIIDRASADDPQWEGALESADLIYFSGGNPHFLYQSLRGSRAWSAMERAWARGAVYAGCSAGAMILAEGLPNLRALGLRQTPGFHVVPAKTIVPHFDRMRNWVPLLLSILKRRLRQGELALGIDENTALVGRLGGEWQVMGAQTVSYITQGDISVYFPGDKLTLPAQQV
jgi:cyanophycinase